MRLVFIFSILFLLGCAHDSSNKTLVVPPHPCFVAAAKGDLEYIQKNLETCKKTKTEQGTTPFMLAASKGQDSILNFLLTNGVDVNELDKTSDSAINYAVTFNQVNSAGLLVLSGANLEAKRPDGITPLMNAVQFSSPEMVNTLVKTRQAINAVAEDGWTALYFSIRRKDPNLLLLLLRSGACKDTLDSYKQTPMDFAKEVGWEQGLLILKSAPSCGINKSPVQK
jgi:ankyrin repeat protein